MDALKLIAQDSLKADAPKFNVGDTVKVHVRIAEGDKFRIQVFEGTVIAKKHGGVSETFTVRRVAHGCGIERVFPLHSPTVEKVEVVREGKVRRAKLYYLRDRVGKAAKVKRNAKRRWRPLKIYLIVTGLFIALVLGLYFYAAPPFSEGQAIVVKDITGQSVKMLPDSEPVELALVGLTDYNGVVRLFYGMITGIVVYRIVSIIAVFIINLLYRRRNAKKAAALRAGNYIP